MAEDLEKTLPQKLRTGLTPAERKLLELAQQGELAVCGPNSDDNDPANDPKNCDNWGTDREIRAELIRWMCVDQAASKHIHLSGIRVFAAKVIGELDLSYASVPFPLRLSRCCLNVVQCRYLKIAALYLDGSVTRDLDLNDTDVTGIVFLKQVFVNGKVQLISARIGDEVNFIGAVLHNDKDYALRADYAEVKGDVNFTGARVEGKILLYGIKVQGDVYFANGFDSNDHLNLAGAQIAGNLYCSRARFTELAVDQTVIRGAFFWTQTRDPSAFLDLTNTSVGSFTDDEASWPTGGNVILDGFVYGHFTETTTDAAARLEWVGRQKAFASQPYRQLSKVLRELGDDDGAKRVLFELQRRLRAEGRSRLVHWPAKWIDYAQDRLYDATVGYGIYPGRAVWHLAGLTALGWVVHWRAHRMNAMAPTEKEAYAHFHSNNGDAPEHYPPFNSFVYSLENCLPLVKFGQDDHWQSDPNPLVRAQSASRASGWGGRLGDWLVGMFDHLITPARLRCLRWIMIALGWLLATFFVAGVSGIIKAD